MARPSTGSFTRINIPATTTTKKHIWHKCKGLTSQVLTGLSNPLTGSKLEAGTALG